MSIEFTQGAWLWLLLAIPLVWFWPVRLTEHRQGILRSLALALIVLGLARPTLPGDRAVDHQVVLWDASSSGGADEHVGDLMQIERRLDDAHTTLVTILDTPAPSSENSPWDASVHLRSSGTPLGSALLAAGNAIPIDAPGGITIVSDGHATELDWGNAAASLVARGIPVHVVEKTGPSLADLRPVTFHVEEPVRVGSTTRAHVEVIGDTRAQVRLFARGADGVETVLAELDEVEVAGRASVVLPFEPKEAGFLQLRVEVQALAGASTDANTLTNELFTEIAVDDPLHVLYLGERVVEGQPKLEQLLGNGFSFESRGTLGSELPDLEQFDLVMLDDRPADTVPERFQEQIADAVANRGLGVVMTGGGGSFGPGGYHESPLAATLPVEFVQKEEKKDPSTALAIIIDTSGSMAGNRITLAKEVSRLAIRRLLPHDKVGIVEFYGTKHWAAPLQSAANAIQIQRALNRLDAGGGTILLPAIEEAYYGLRNAQTRYKHVLVLTDAGVETGPYESLLRRMARDGICVSTVLVGPPRHGEFLVQLADWGNGRFYNASDRFNLPEIMLKQPSTARLPAYRPGTHGVEPRGGMGWWGEVDPTTVPAVSGYVESRARPGAEVVLRTREEGHPVLASWRAGLGRATTLLTEPAGPGTQGWSEWSDYGAFLARVLTRTASDSLGAYRFTLEEAGTELRLVAERRDASAGEPRAVRVLPGEGSVPLVFRARAPGVSVARISRRRSEAVRIEAFADGARHRTRLVSPEFSGVSPEGQVDPERALDLSALAAATGGRVVLPTELASFLPPAGGGEVAKSVRELASLCFLFALAAYLFEIFYRRSRFHRSRVVTPAVATRMEAQS